MNNELKHNNIYFPCVFPLPDYHLGFLPFNYKDKKVISFYTQIAPHNPDDFLFYSVSMLENICRFFKLNNYEVHLVILTHKDLVSLLFTQLNQFCEELKIETEPYSYDILYKRMLDCDMGIVFLHDCSTGGSQFDFISLGKPVIFCAQYLYSQFYSPFYNRPDLIYFQSANSNNYLENYMKNLEYYYGGLAETISDYDFYNWQHIINKLF